TTKQAGSFQPMKPNQGLLPPLSERLRGKRERGEAYAVRALADIDAFIRDSGILDDSSEYLA
ncbi:MAG: hypothetical protein R6X16_10335, partial [Anaerolineae bacterium]